MKKIIVLCTLSMLAVTLLVWRAVAKPSQFGKFTGAPKAEVARVIADPKAFLGKTIQLESTVTEQCKSMGCFFFFRSGKDTLRVDVQEVAMTAPIRDGHISRVEGQVVPYNDGYQFYATAVEFQ